MLAAKILNRAIHVLATQPSQPMRWLTVPLVSVEETRRLKERSIVVPHGAVWLHKHPSGDMLWAGPRANGTPSYLAAETEDVFLHGATIREGTTVVDVGAGVGEDVPVFSRAVGPTGSVIAIEAHPLAHKVLTENIKRWQLQNVVAIHAAVTAQEGEVLISNMEASVGNRIGSSGVPVPAKPLDLILTDLGVNTTSMIKMNIEGAERQAVRGMGESLKNSERVVISCHDFLVPLGSDPAEVATRSDVEAFLENLGMKVERRVDDPRPWVPDYLYASWG